MKQNRETAKDSIRQPRSSPQEQRNRKTNRTSLSASGVMPDDQNKDLIKVVVMVYLAVCVAALLSMV